MRALVIGAVLATGCAPTTQLLAVIDTDLVPGDEVAAVLVRAGSGASGSSARFETPDETSFPFSVGLAPVGGDASREVAVYVEAVDRAGNVVVRWTADTGYVAGRTLLLPVRLSRHCLGEPACETEFLVCDGDRCRDLRIDPATLETVDPGAPPRRLFSGPSDGAVEPDAGAPCVAGEACETANRCEVGVLACDPVRCVASGLVPAGTECGDGRTCTAAGACL